MNRIRPRAGPGRPSPCFQGGLGGPGDRPVDEPQAAFGAIVEKAVHLQMALDHALEHAIVTMDHQGCITGWNKGAQALTGYAEADMLGAPGDLLCTAEDRDAGRFQLELVRVLAQGAAVNERWHQKRDGSRFWASGSTVLLPAGVGRPPGFLAIFCDRTAREAERELIVGELTHRLKNTYAMVEAVAVQTGRRAASAGAFEATFIGRLRALARSNDLLLQAGSAAAPLGEVIERAVAPFAAEPGRVSVKGAPAVLSAALVLPVGLALHELGTNAVKHGALSTPAGRVRVGWTVAGGGGKGRRVRITWRESGGPVVAPPTRRGFGTQLLERGLSRDAAIRLEFRPDGLRCELVLPVAAPGIGTFPPARA